MAGVQQHPTPRQTRWRIERVFRTYRGDYCGDHKYQLQKRCLIFWRTIGDFDTLDAAESYMHYLIRPIPRAPNNIAREYDANGTPI